MTQQHPNDILCHCLHVSTQEVEQVIESGHASNLAEVKQEIGAGGGCSACHCAIRDLLGHCRNEKQTMVTASR